MKKEIEPKVRLSIVLTLIIASVIGFLAGVIGELWVNAFLVPEVKLRSFQDLTKRLDDLTAQKDKSLKDLLSDQDFAINKVVEKIQPLAVNFYPVKKNDVSLSGVYLDNEILGAGMVLTADGWLVTTKKVINEKDKNYVANLNNKIYKIEKIVSDKITDVVFCKISENNLPVANLISKKNLTFGQSVIVVANGKTIRASIDDLYHSPILKPVDLIKSSESLYRYILLKGDYTESDVGAPVFTLDGQVLGILSSIDGTVLPIDYFSSIIKSAIQKQEINRNFLGINFLDLELAKNYPIDRTQGALIMGDSTRKAVIAGSPAQAAKLQSGDIIVKIENDEINRNQTLSELIQEYLTETEIKFTIIRKGETIIVPVKLGKF